MTIPCLFLSNLILHLVLIDALFFVYVVFTNIFSVCALLSLQLHSCILLHL